MLVTISHFNGFFKLVEALLQIHPCCFSHSMKLVLSLSVVTVLLEEELSQKKWSR